jgi:hypothetical protein
MQCLRLVKELISSEDRVGLPAAIADCVNAFFAELKQHIRCEWGVFDLLGLSMDDVIEFILDNEALKTLILISEEPLSLEQSSALSRAIGSVQLKEVNLQSCRFENDGSFEQMIESCATVDRLKVTCVYHSQCTALAAFIREPARALTVLDLTAIANRLDAQQVFREISESLVGNTSLKDLRIWSMRAFNWVGIEKLLCNASTIRGIYNSNHTLEEIKNFHSLSKLTRQYLLLNENADKTKVIRNKILGFYFVGEFDLSPFSGMAVSVLPEVMIQIAEEHKHSAIYRLLQQIPDLCNVSNRVDS